MKSAADLPDAHLRTFDRPPLPPSDAIDDVYLIGICGTGMGALAGLFRQAGYAVRGSDEAAYPPMSTHLADQGIPVLEGYDPAHLDPPPDLTIVGNACTPTHPEATTAREGRYPQASFPEALGHYVLDDPSRRSIVVAGTHGKTTTTGLVVHLLETAGLQPGFLVGGVMQGRNTSYTLGQGAPFVVEGDEYDSAYFDKRPKFVHYRPHRAIVTSLEFDHADIYDGLADYQRAFEHFVDLLPSDAGPLALCGDHKTVRALAAHTRAPVRTYGLAPHNDVSATHVQPTAQGQSFTLVIDDTMYTSVHLPLHGRHNLQNALGAAVIARAEGASVDQIADGLSSFAGMKRRQTVRGEPGGVLVIDDFAHHPTAVSLTLEGLRTAHPDRRLLAVFEPRSNSSRRKVFETAYAHAFDAADQVFLKAPPVRHNDEAATMLDPETVVRRLREQHIPAWAFADVDALLPRLLENTRSGDVAVLMSNGSFDGLHDQLLDALG